MSRSSTLALTILITARNGRTGPAGWPPPLAGDKPTDQPGREIRGVEAMHASDRIAAWRWWTLAELDSTSEVVWPAELADVIRTARREAGQ